MFANFIFSSEFLIPSSLAISSVFNCPASLYQLLWKSVIVQAMIDVNVTVKKQQAW
jgi:hypothetical protein